MDCILGHFMVILACLCLHFNVIECLDCKFSASGKSVDFEDLANSEIQSDYKKWTFIMQFCQNNIKCGDQSVMAIQDNEGSCTSTIAKWPSDGVTPTYSSSNGGTWSFSFSNGGAQNCDSNRKLDVDFICSSSSASYDSSSTVITETESCAYEWDVYTKYACTSGSSSSSGDDDEGSISVGTILIIVVLCSVFLYCIGGYVWNVKRSEDGDWKDVKTNAPHLSFWCLIPKLTWAGCCVSKEWTLNKINQYRGGGGSELITESGDDDEM